jgi:hypothetical protein
VLEKLFHTVSMALETPEVTKKFEQQHFNVVPNKSLDDAHEWLAGEMEHWRDITGAVKVDVGQ